jgi:hypothetical protein
MLKFLFAIVVIFCLFIFFMLTAMTSVPYFTSKHYQKNESPSYIFKVVLEYFEPTFNEPRFECVWWDDFKEIFQASEVPNVYICKEADNCLGYPFVPEREFSAYLSVPEGSCTNISSEFKVQNVAAHTQVVRLRWAQEAFKVRNSYRVEASTVAPLYLCKFMSAGIAVNLFLVSIIAIPMTFIFFRFCHKKYGKLISTGWAFVLIGLSTLNFAVFNHRLSLDPLTEHPEVFIYRNKIVLIVSGIFFVSAGISFWIHKRRRLSAVDRDYKPSQKQ